MKNLLVSLLIWMPAMVLAQSTDDELVNVKELIPGIVIDLKYNTMDNFFQQKLYTTNECFLAHGAARALKRVQDSLHTRGLGVKIWDGYRPRAIQYLMWEILPDSRYVADPASGSVHNRGGAVDLTLIDLSTGQELPMPTPFDFFGPQAGHDFMNLPADVIANRTLLRTMMENVGGFSTYITEWWHYTYNPASGYPLMDFQMK